MKIFADAPNSKWVTEISYIHTKQDVLYLSVMQKPYDRSMVAYKTETEQTSGAGYNLAVCLQGKAVQKTKVAPLTLHHFAENFILPCMGMF